MAADLPDGWRDDVAAILEVFPERLDEYDDPPHRPAHLAGAHPGRRRHHRRGVHGPGDHRPDPALHRRAVGPAQATCPTSPTTRSTSTSSSARYGDTFDRYAIRLNEIRESIKIVRQILDAMPAGDYRVQDKKVTPPPRARIDESMEALIHHFKIFTEGFKVPEGEVYVAVESPRGELGCYLVSDGCAKPYRLHIRGPSFVNLQALPHMIRGGLIADAVAVISHRRPDHGRGRPVTIPALQSGRDWARAALQSGRHWVRRRDPVRWVLGGMIAIWSVVFTYLGWLRYTRFTTFGYDLGIYDQGIWLLSRFADPFVTVKGLDLFGHHTNLILLAFVPFYWLGAGPPFLLVVQVASQASGAIAVFLLARDRLADRWLALALAAVLLLNPTYQYLVWEYFHPDALAIAPLLFAYWAARAKRWRWYVVAVVLAMACKEDVALAVAGLGLLIWFRGDRRIGVATFLGAIGWFVLSTRVLMRWALGGLSPFYDYFFPDLGRNAGEVARTAVDPSRQGRTRRHPLRPPQLLPEGATAVLVPPDRRAGRPFVARRAHAGGQRAHLDALRPRPPLPLQPRWSWPGWPWRRWRRWPIWGAGGACAGSSWAWSRRSPWPPRWRGDRRR